MRPSRYLKVILLSLKKLNTEAPITLENGTVKAIP